MEHEAVYTCSACGKSVHRSALTLIGSAYACKTDPTCGRYLRKIRKTRKLKSSHSGRQVAKYGGR